jgi:Protein of unknown function (DUF3159)
MALDSGHRADAAGARSAETLAYEAAVEKAFGGKKGMADIGLPSLVFVVVYTITKDLTPSIWASVGLAVAMTAFRLLKRDSLKYAAQGLVGVLVCAGWAWYSGKPQDYYLPGILINIAYGAVFILTALIRWPIVGVMLGFITGEMTSWRKVPGRMRAFMLSTWLLAAVFVLRTAVMLPLYFAGQTSALGAAKIVLGYPPYVAAIYVCWQIIKQAPPPVKVGIPGKVDEKPAED